MLRVAHGNLLEARVDALVNTVNTEGVMGKGIALQFKRAFPANFEEYERDVKAGKVTVGQMHVHRNPELVGPRYIINFPTKKHWRHPSRIEWIRTGLDALVKVVRELGIKSIALPPLGCGYGGLSWEDVSRLIAQTAATLPEVDVHVYPPEGAPPPEQMPDRTPRPPLTVGRAGLIALMQRYMASGFDDSVSLLEIQKLLYFLQEAGQPLRLQFAANRYGPYADNLRHVLVKLEGHYLSGFGDGSVSPETVIRVLPGAATDADRIVGEHKDMQTRFERVARLIDGFETPFGMELLATVHWVAHHEPRARSAADATESVRRWSTRKAALMTSDSIGAAWDRLVEEGWVAAPSTAK